MKPSWEWQYQQRRLAQQREQIRLSLHEAGHAVLVFISSPDVEIKRVA